MDAICHVVRTFTDDSIYHIDGSIDPKRDIDFVNAELLLHDLIFIEKRAERLDKTIKQTKEENAVKERELLGKLKGHLDFLDDEQAAQMVDSFSKRRTGKVGNAKGIDFLQNLLKITDKGILNLLQDIPLFETDLDLVRVNNVMSLHILLISFELNIFGKDT